ncbi:MAG: tRNA 4-thiouridine(8) synthase ThiI [Acholeplasmatales bacterium]|jgi:thiamine biosynthesis protein ThiI|nr:tRNA 4-thiouridine(8) synthase ThiI [Acholeplasmatales bacterium]
MKKVMLRYGELILKKENAKYFKNRVVSHILYKLREFDKNSYKVNLQFDLIFIDYLEEIEEKLISIFKKIPGLDSYSKVYFCSKEIIDIVNTAANILNTKIDPSKTIKFETKRIDKTFNYKSNDFSMIIAPKILSLLEPKFKVDVHNPDVTITFLIKQEGTYIYSEKINLMGGLPYMMSGETILLLSGGIDSPVAAYYLIKRGLSLRLLHFESTPLTSLESINKVLDIASKLSSYTNDGEIELNIVPFYEIHKKILDTVEDSYIITILRRMMFRIADRFGSKIKVFSISTGESLGQVASQTLESMQTIEETTNKIIFRPLLTFDKNEVIKIARLIETFDISIRPFSDCCSIYVPKHPIIKPNVNRARYNESLFEFEDLINKAVEGIFTIKITENFTSDLSNLGISFSDIKEELKK